MPPTTTAPVIEPPPNPLRLTIDLDALAANWRTMARLSDTAATGAAIKADAYGLGAAPVLARLAAAGCRDFFVATWAEAAALLPLADGLTLHVLHGVMPGEAAFARASGCVPVLNSVEQVALWREAVPGEPCDLMVDTGMNRLGLAPADLARAHGLAVDLLMSHLACADDPGNAANARQLAAFTELAAPHRRRSLVNSAGVHLGAAYAFDLTRPGLALYGGSPCPGASGLAQVAHLEARVLQVRTAAPGDTVGYGATFTAARATRLAIVNAGYADGLPRAPGGVARVDGVDAPVVGRVSMDLTAIDVTDAPPIAAGDWLELAFDLPHAAEASGRSQYELLTGLGHRFERRYTGAAR